MKKIDNWILQSDPHLNTKKDTLMEQKGCYLLCLLSYALYPLEKTQHNYNVINTYRSLCIKRGWLDKKNLYVENPLALHNNITKNAEFFAVRKETGSYQATDAESEVQVWSYIPEWGQYKGQRLSHFIAIHEIDGEVYRYDPLGDSACVSQGVIRSKRVLTR